VSRMWSRNPEASKVVGRVCTRSVARGWRGAAGRHKSNSILAFGLWAAFRLLALLEFGSQTVLACIETAFLRLGFRLSPECHTHTYSVIG